MRAPTATSDGVPRFVFSITDTATTEIYTLSLHDALPISMRYLAAMNARRVVLLLLFHSWLSPRSSRRAGSGARSEEHTSELQSQSNLVCRLLLEKKKQHMLVRHPQPGCHRLRVPGAPWSD